MRTCFRKFYVCCICSKLIPSGVDATQLVVFQSNPVPRMFTLALALNLGGFQSSASFVLVSENFLQ